MPRPDPAALDGEHDLATAEELTFIGTRRYVRRQRSWFRRDHRIQPARRCGAGTHRRRTRGADPDGCAINGPRILEPVTTISEAVTYVKGHGTQNDFVVLTDPAVDLDLTVDFVAAVCDRQRGGRRRCCASRGRWHWCAPA